MILCSGEALIDMLPRRTGDGAEAFAPRPGGSVFNTARALGRLGVPTAYHGGLSTDLFGEMLADALRESEVDISLAERSGRPTTLAFVELTGGDAQYTFYDENSAGRMLRPEGLPTLSDAIEALFFGCISLVPMPCAGAHEALMRAAGDRAVMLDLNIRPGFVGDAEAYRARLERMMSRADIVKASDDDLAWWSGSGDAEEIARQILKNGPSLVCLTRGAAGAHGLTSEDEVFVEGARVDVVDTVGAGDTFNAGLMAALRRDGHLTRAGLRQLDAAAVREAIAYGQKAAAITVGRAGADPPRADEIG